MSFVKASRFFLWGFPISHATTQSTSFVRAAMVYSSRRVHGKRILTEPTLERRFLISTCSLIRYVPANDCSRLHHHLTFLLQDIIPSKPTQTYVPRIYGFRVNEASAYYRNREDDQNDSQLASRQSRRSRRQGRK